MCAALILMGLLLVSESMGAQQDPFRWMDFHGSKDQDIVAWVTRSLLLDDWTAIREIGVQYDSALVVTTKRARADAPASADTMTVWTVSLTSHDRAPLLTGANLRWLDFMRFSDNGMEPTALYDSCRECAVETYFTAFHYVAKNHAWSARWMRNGQGVPVWSTNTPTGMVWTQAYAGLAEADGRALMGTWNRFDYGPQKPMDDYLFVYDVDPNSGLERTRRLSGAEAEALKLRVCQVQDALPGVARGQDGPLCQTVIPRAERKPVTTPPANAQGRSTPPGGKKR
jgi:hypothetical protein